MKNYKKNSLLFLLAASLLITGCDAAKIMDVISKVADGVKKAVPEIKKVIDTISGITKQDNATPDTTQQKQQVTQTPQEISNPGKEPSVVVISPKDDEEVSAQNATPATPNTTPVTTTPAPAQVENPAQSATSTSINISAKGQNQMDSVADYALNNHLGGSNGQCFKAVWGYLTSSGYGKLSNWNDLPNMESAEARHFAEFLNASQQNLDEAGLQRLDTALTPPITSPHDPRIPKGAVIVVAAGSTGTAHPTAGDIVVKAGEGRFVNDGPNMDYGSADEWTGTLLGVYIPN